jgi:hypothetical protein
VATCRSWVNRRFGGRYRLHLQGRKICERGTSVSRWLLRLHVPPKRRFTQDLHVATSQKTASIIVTAVKTSNLTYSINHPANLSVCVVDGIADPMGLFFTALYLMRLLNPRKLLSFGVCCFIMGKLTTCNMLWRVYPLLGNVSVNTFPRKRTRATIRLPLLGNGSVNKPPWQ